MPQTTLPGVSAKTRTSMGEMMAALDYLTLQEETNSSQQFLNSLHEARLAVARLPGDEYYEEILSIIHRPGWTTDGEGVYFEAMVDLIRVYTSNLSQLHQQLMDAAKRVPTD